MSCFLRYYYKLKNCDTSAEFWSISDEIRTVEIGCFFINQLTGDCLELLSNDATAPDPMTVFSPVQLSCHAPWNTCEQCLSYPAKPGCTAIKTACNYDPCATIDDGSCEALVNITFKILCPGTIELCTEPSSC